MAKLAASLTTTPAKRYALAAVAAILALAAVFAAIKIPSASADALGAPQTAVAIVGDIESTVLASGTLQAENQVNVGAQVSGQVNSLKVVLGQQVKKGDLIAEIDATAQKSDLINAAAALKSLDAQMQAKQVALRLAETAFRRQRQMLDQDATSPADYDNAEAAQQVARADIAALDAQIEQARAQANKTRVDAERTSIRAPINGTVVAIVTKEGQTLNSAQQVPTIVKLARLDKMQVRIQISEADVARVKPGQRVHFTLMGDAGQRYTSRLQVVEPVPDAANQDGAGGGGAAASAVYYNGLFSLPNPGGKLRIGMTAQVTIVLASAKKAVVIPLAALGEKRRNGQYVVQVLKNGKPVERQVRVGVRNNQIVQIVKGLKAGEHVVLAAGSVPPPVADDA